MKQITVIGDIHGRDTWKTANLDADKVIFIGDYFDSYDITPRQQFENFLEILEFKIKNPERVILLTGNHDLHYLVGEDLGTSGFNHMTNILAHDVLQDAYNKKLVQMAYAEDTLLFSHAGISKTWYNNMMLLPVNYQEENINTIVEMCNSTFLGD